MDARNFLSHLNSRRPIPIVGSTSTGLPSHVVPTAPTSRAPVTLPAARPQGLAGNPPYNKERYPASFAGRKPGSKSKAPNRRQMQSALAAAIAMKSGDAKFEADATAPDFLERFGVKRNVITRITNGLVAGDVTMVQAMSDFASSAEKGGHPISGFSSTLKGSFVRQEKENESHFVNIERDKKLPLVEFTEHHALPRTEFSNRALNRMAKNEERREIQRIVRNQAAPGQTSSAGGTVPGGEIASTVPTAAVVAPVSTVETPEPSLPGAVGAGGGSSSNGVGLADSNPYASGLFDAVDAQIEAPPSAAEERAADGLARLMDRRGAGATASSAAAAASASVIEQFTNMFGRPHGNMKESSMVNKIRKGPGRT